jgi:hypothetical protein
MQGILFPRLGSSCFGRLAHINLHFHGVRVQRCAALLEDCDGTVDSLLAWGCQPSNAENSSNLESGASHSRVDCCRNYFLARNFLDVP